METIDKTHPSLKGHILKQGMGEPYMMTTLCLAEDIQKHTIDKDVLKEKMLEVVKELHVPVCDCKHPDASDGIDLLKEKLGLEGE